MRRRPPGCRGWAAAPRRAGRTRRRRRVRGCGARGRATPPAGRAAPRGLGSSRRALDGAASAAGSRRGTSSAQSPSGAADGTPPTGSRRRGRPHASPRSGRARCPPCPRRARTRRARGDGGGVRCQPAKAAPRRRGAAPPLGGGARRAVADDTTCSGRRAATGLAASQQHVEALLPAQRADGAEHGAVPASGRGRARAAPRRARPPFGASPGAGRITRTAAAR